MAQRGRPKKEKTAEELAKLANKTPGKRGRPKKEEPDSLTKAPVVVETTQVPLEDLKTILSELKQDETKAIKSANTPGVSPIKVNIIKDHMIRKN